jgi:hypothetical protein
VDERNDSDLDSSSLKFKNQFGNILFRVLIFVVERIQFGRTKNEKEMFAVME